MKISLSRWNATDAAAYLKNDDLTLKIGGGEGFDPVKACKDAATTLRDAALQFELLALESYPYRDNVQSRINATAIEHTLKNNSVSEAKKIGHTEFMKELEHLLKDQPVNYAAEIWGNTFVLRKGSIICMAMTTDGRPEVDNPYEPDGSAWEESLASEAIDWLDNKEFNWLNFSEVAALAKALEIEPEKTTQFEYKGMNIHNPMLSSCGRDEVSPKTYGFNQITTGGGCMAWQRLLEDGGYLLITDTDGIHLPDSWEEAIIGRYDREGAVVVEAHPLTFDAPLDDVVSPS